MRPVRFLSVITAFGFVVLGLVFAPSLLAQDTPTSEPTAIPTDLPTATETLTATPTASATETPMLIPTPTETPTPEPTLTPTETPTTFSSETPTASTTFEETATLTETATAWETVTETPTASGDVMEGEGWVGLGGRAAVQNGALMSAQDAGTPHNLEFIEDFNGNNYLYFWQQPGITTVSGLPLDNITTEGYARSSLQAGEPLELQTTVQLGSDPNISYSVTDFNFYVYFNISPSSLAETHEILMVFKDLSGGTIFTTPSCQWVPSKPLPSPLCPNWTWTMPIHNVKTVTIIYRTINPITPSSSGARYTISLDNLKFVTSELVYPPTTPTPSATPTLPPEPYPINGRIAFVDEDSNGDADIYTMSTTTGNRTQLTASNGEDSHPALSPDGGWVAFVNGSYQQGDILVKPATADYTDNSLLRQLTSDSVDDNYPVWSPDGTKIAFVSTNRYDPTTFSYVTGIFLMNADGTGTPILIYEGSAAELSWSHANNQLLFVAYNYDTESDDLYVLDMNNPSAGREMVQAHIGSDRFPVWSPDGNQIAFASQRTADPNQTGQFNIYVMDSACLILPEGCTNAEVEAVTTFTVQDAIHPAWSPDGDEIAFTTYNPFYTDDPQYDYSDTLTFFQIYRRNTGGASGAMSMSAMSSESTGEWSQVRGNPPNSIPKFVAWSQVEVATAVCSTSFPAGINIRSIPSPSSTPSVSSYTGQIGIAGWYREPNPANWPDPPYDTILLSHWYFIVYTSPNAQVYDLEGWIPGFLLNFENPAEACQGQGIVPEVDVNGNLMAVPTPTPTSTSTPFMTTTPYPAPTAGATPTPPPPGVQLCNDKPGWIQTLCLQGWNYLPDDARNELYNSLAQNPNASDFITLDTWWLQRVRRGITDVPPSVWQADSLTQCANYVNRSACESIVRDASYLFDHMGRIGVDWANAGLGQALVINSLPNLKQQALWFLPQNDIPTSIWQNYWGWVQGTGGYACGNNRFGAQLPGFDALADVCWVCQDVPTTLYLRVGYDLKQRMYESEMRLPNPNDPNDIFNPAVHQYNEAYFRNVPAMADFGDIARDGGVIDYRIGEMAFLYDPTLYAGQNIDNDFLRYPHIGIVVRGATLGMPFDQALDHVLIAQISYTSQGFFQSASDSIELSPPGWAGRFEIITLRTYLYKHMTNISTEQNPVQVPPVNPQDAANIYMAHWAPVDLNLDLKPQ